MNEVTPTPTKRHHKIFLWFFLAVQAIFVLWLVFGVSDAQTSGCTPGYQDACNAGTAVGVFLVVVFWVLVDMILGIGYGVYRLATKR